MKNNTLILLAVLVVLALAAGAAFVLRPPAEASAPIEAPALEPDNQLAPADEQPAVEQFPAEEPAAEQPAEPENPAFASGLTIFGIIQAESQVRFSIDEELSNEPFTAVGVTDQVAGQIGVDLAAPANSQVGTIIINARTFKTDNSFRDRAIQNQILKSSQFEYITFTPTAITGLPESAAVGDSFTFQITGDMTITGVTASETFDVTVTWTADDRLEGYAAATVLRSTYGLLIPSVPQVANVSDEVLLEIDFVAVLE